jgi:hypothetical protein
MLRRAGCRFFCPLASARGGGTQSHPVSSRSFTRLHDLPDCRALGVAVSSQQELL